jgi:cysteine synthase A
MFRKNLKPMSYGLSGMIGHTPMIQLKFNPENATLYAKCEFQNPSGSIKDRFAHAVIAHAEDRGLLRPDSIILECSSGNTGVALSMLGASKGYKVKIVISAVASRERRLLMEHFGAEVVTFDGDDYWKGVKMTRDMAASDKRYFLPRQFENQLNAVDHQLGTGREILEQVGGRIDAFVAGYGTGGTLAGVSRALRKRYPSVKVFVMEPAESAILLGESPCSHQIEGVADGFVPALLSGVAHEGVIKVPSLEAMQMAQRLSREFGLPVGTSSGANVVASLEVAKRFGPGSRIVTLLCDRAERYFSTSLFTRSDVLPSARIVAVD